MILASLLLAAQGGLTSVPARELAPLQEPAKTWKGSADASATLVSGNNESTTVGANANIEGTWGAWSAGANAGYTGVRTTDKATGDATTTARIITLGANGKRYLDDENNLYTYVKAGDRRDSPNGLNERYDLGGGLGYKFDLYENAYIGTEIGASWVNEDLVGVASSSSSGALRAAYNFEAPIIENLKAFGNGEYLNGGDVEAFTNLTGVRYNFRPNWYFQAALQLIYDGSPAPGFKSTDQIFILGLGLSF